MEDTIGEVWMGDEWDEMVILGEGMDIIVTLGEMNIQKWLHEIWLLVTGLTDHTNVIYWFVSTVHLLLWDYFFIKVMYYFTVNCTVLLNCTLHYCTVNCTVLLSCTLHYFTDHSLRRSLVTVVYCSDGQYYNSWTVGPPWKW